MVATNFNEEDMNWTLLHAVWPILGRHVLHTQKLIGRGGCKIKLLLQILSQEGSKTSNYCNLHTRSKDNTGEHRVRQQMFSHLGNH